MTFANLRPSLRSCVLYQISLCEAAKDLSLTLKVDMAKSVVAPVNLNAHTKRQLRLYDV